MPRQRITHRRVARECSDDFADTLERLKRESGLSWSEMARRLGTSDLTLRRWRNGMHPNWGYTLALLELAEELGLADVLPFRRSGGRVVGRAVPALSAFTTYAKVDDGRAVKGLLGCACR